jgi:hypothetical protein
MIPLELFNGPEMETRRRNAFAKAQKDKPIVSKLADGPNREFYSVNQYTVEILTDADGQEFAGCSCPASSPPIDEATGLPKYESMPCYHLAATLAFRSRGSER